MGLTIIKKIIQTLNNLNKNLKNRQPILIFISSYTSAPVLSMLAARLIDSKEKVFFVIQKYDENLLKKIKKFAPGFTNEFLVIEEEAQKFTPTLSGNKLYFEEIAQKYNENDFSLNTFSALYNTMLNEINTSMKILSQHNPKLLVIPEDGISANFSLIKAALSLKIPILDVPYGYGSHRDLDNAVYEKQLNNDLYHTKNGIGMLVKKYYPQWEKKGNYEGTLLFNPHFILALEELGISVKNAWTIHGGYADKLTAESIAMYNHYINEGIQKEKIYLTGTLYCDYLKNIIDSDEKYLQAYLKSKKIDNNTTSILICWPPSYHNERGDFCEYSSYEELTKMVLNQLGKIKNVTITLNLHPAVQSQFLPVIEKTDINISEEYILDEIPKHDIYISCYSSTIRWAIAARKPVINYDFYNFNLKDYSSVPGVLRAEKNDDFNLLINKLINDDQYYHQIALAQKKSSSDWGMLDGQNFERIYNLINIMTYQEVVNYN
ncbi:hypothetical protein ELY21_01540 [Legionella sp. km535]|uniref:hypothetical protein n=1 Tax=Legionella sp. km535 TaxID=2498107 RepID=UPI000F8F4031|nr:hypothetical protein [Legionella sp. km535]RUR20227.1 hypothetical protein ELY21_01540 [Legionella sp. km535]